jgi:hypothetical protein
MAMESAAVRKLLSGFMVGALKKGLVPEPKLKRLF